MDNKYFEIHSSGKEQFTLAMKIALADHNKVIGYKIDKEKGMILYWSKCDGVIEFPYVMNEQGVIDFVFGWVEATPVGTGRPDHDGDNDKGFRVYCESWGHVGGYWQAFVAIEPIWAMYGK